LTFSSDEYGGKQSTSHEQFDEFIHFLSPFSLSGFRLTEYKFYSLFWQLLCQKYRKGSKYLLINYKIAFLPRGYRYAKCTIRFSSGPQRTTTVLNGLQACTEKLCRYSKLKDKTKMKQFHTYLLLVLLPVFGCEISAVDYAVDDLRITDKVKMMSADGPAIKMTVKNIGEEDYFQINIPVKARKQQRDLSVKMVSVARLAAAESVDKTVVFTNLSSHSDYDFLTYAITSSP
jgi:hypothetical protein